MKSQAEFMLSIACGILQDAELAYPYMSVDLGRDLNTLTRLSKDRGIGLFCLDLPALDNHLLGGLSSGRLIAKANLPLSGRRSKAIQVPKLFSGLWLRVFDSNGQLHKLEAIDQNSILFLRQLFCIGKKLELPCAHHRVVTTLGEYYDIERSILSPSLRWGSENIIEDPCACSGRKSPVLDLEEYHQEEEKELNGLTVMQAIQQVADTALGGLPSLDLEEHFNSFDRGEVGFGFRHGPGVISDAKKNVSKYSFSSWSNKLNSFIPESTFNGSQGIKRAHMRYEVPSRLIMVPKTAKSPRLIAAESGANQFCQQWLRARLEEITKRGGELHPFIDFKSQEKSQRLAQKGSLCGQLSTIDLSSASDRLSCHLVERIFRNRIDYLSAINAVRTSHLFIEEHGQLLKLKKLASQGSAITFPIQTIVFQIIALGVLYYLDKGRVGRIADKSLMPYLRGRYRGQTRVFGDDIIIPTHAYATMCNTLTTLGLKVNGEKSFSEGLFRESCGGDFFMGYNVTPMRLRYAHNAHPISRQSNVEATNLLFRNGFWRTSEVLRMELHRQEPHLMRVLPIIAPGSGFTGLTSFCGSSLAHLKKRWNKHLQVEEVRVCKFYTQVEIRRREGLSCLLQFLVDNPVGQIINWKSGDVFGRPPVLEGTGWAPSYRIAS